MNHFFRNPITWMVAAGFSLLFIAVGILFIVFGPTESPEPVSPNQATDPFAGLGTSAPLFPGSGGLSLALNDGSTAQVPDFTKAEQPVWVSQFEYQVTGSPLETFLITYLQPDQNNPQGEFLVTLLTEPLGGTRIAAEAALKASLGLNDTQLCGLDADIAAGPGVNEQYPPDKNLGFSMCTGATQLP